MDFNNKEIEFLKNDKVFYKGVIEDNEDPKHYGRVRVRLLGFHSMLKSEVPTSTLPWANVLQSLHFGGFISGKGISSIPTVGTWVWCFIDNKDCNNIVVIGAISGISNTQDSSIGFSDPSSTYPLQDRIGTPDINSRVVDTGYTTTHTIETPSGNIIEIDDKNGIILVKHINGAYINITNDSINAILNKSTSFSMTSGKIDIIGNVNVQGIITATEDVVTNNISLKSHIHSGVTSGTSSTGTPE